MMLIVAKHSQVRGITCLLYKHVSLCSYSTSHSPPNTSNLPTKKKHTKPPPKQWSPENLVMKREESYDSIEVKKKEKKPWTPSITLSYTEMEQLRMLHNEDSSTYDIKYLSARYRLPFDAVKRILKSKFIPTPEQIAQKETNRKQQYLDYLDQKTKEIEAKSEPRPVIVIKKNENMDTDRLMRLIQRKPREVATQQSTKRVNNQQPTTNNRYPKPKNFSTIDKTARKSDKATTDRSFKPPKKSNYNPSQENKQQINKNYAAPKRDVDKSEIAPTQINQKKQKKKDNKKQSQGKQPQEPEETT